MDEQTKSQAIFASMVRQAGDAIEDLRSITMQYYSKFIDSDPETLGKLQGAIKTLETLTAFIQGIQATQGSARNSYLTQSQPLSVQASKQYTNWLKQWDKQDKDIYQAELRQIEREQLILEEMQDEEKLDNDPDIGMPEECDCGNCIEERKRVKDTLFSNTVAANLA